MLMQLTHILLVFLTASVYTVAGRIVFTHTSLNRHQGTPLNCFVVGSGVWFLWFLVLHGALNVSLGVVWYTFLISTFALSTVLTRILQTPQENVLFWPKVAIGLVMALPGFWVLTSDGPALWAELSHYLKNSYHLLSLNGVPDAGKALTLDVFTPLVHMASQLMALPVMLMAHAFLPATMPLFNGVILVLAAAEIARQCRVEVSWHNLVAVTATGLFAITMFNPFFVDAIIFSSYPDVAIAALIFSLSLPFMRNQNLCVGLGALPYGIGLAYLVGLTPLGVPLVMFFVVAYGLKLALNWQLYRTRLLEAMLAMVALCALPIMAHFLLLLAHQNRGYALWPGDVFSFGNIFDGISRGAQGLNDVVMAWPMVGLMLGVVAFMALIRLAPLRFGKSLDGIFVARSQILFPLYLMVFYLVFLGGQYLAGFVNGGLGIRAPFSQGMLHYVLHLQFVILTPLWVWVYRSYKMLFPGRGGAMSAMFSVVMALLFMSVVAVNSNRMTYKPTPALAHTLQVAQAMKADESFVNWGDKVAVLDGSLTQGYYAVSLAYGLREHAKVRPVLQQFANAAGRFDLFHDSLLQGGFNYLWVHNITPDIALVLGNQFRQDESYLMEVTPEGLIPLKTYSHAGYTYTQAAYIPLY